MIFTERFDETSTPCLGVQTGGDALYRPLNPRLSGQAGHDLLHSQRADPQNGPLKDPWVNLLIGPLLRKNPEPSDGLAQQGRGTHRPGSGRDEPLRPVLGRLALI